MPRCFSSDHSPRKKWPGKLPPSLPVPTLTPKDVFGPVKHPSEKRPLQASTRKMSQNLEEILGMTSDVSPLMNVMSRKQDRIELMHYNYHNVSKFNE